MRSPPRTYPPPAQARRATRSTARWSERRSPQEPAAPRDAQSESAPNVKVSPASCFSGIRDGGCCDHLWRPCRRCEQPVPSPGVQVDAAPHQRPFRSTDARRRDGTRPGAFNNDSPDHAAASGTGGARDHVWRLCRPCPSQTASRHAARWSNLRSSRDHLRVGAAVSALRWVAGLAALDGRARAGRAPPASGQGCCRAGKGRSSHGQGS
jgi:hypothetical protein